MDLGIAGRHAAVAAASAGLGLSCARALVREGVHVTICGRAAERVEDAAAVLRAQAGGGAEVVGLVADVATSAGATGFVEQAAGYRPVDILVTNAGGPPPGTFASTDLAAYGPALELNLLSTVAMCKAAVPPMAERGWGRVVAITSITVRQPAAALILSNTARAGATGFLKTLATEVAGRGVTVNSLQPGLHATARLRALHGGDVSGLGAGLPTGTIGDPDDFGAVAAFLCSMQARFVTGVALQVDGGGFPGLL
ncbi:MAG TPA: SDR family oxidoreductase [Acidimicrobiales bacterium]|nr:SDR family oxidoreductase [Acidimicrobiales bacterium]